MTTEQRKQVEGIRENHDPFTEYEVDFLLQLVQELDGRCADLVSETFWDESVAEWEQAKQQRDEMAKEYLRLYCGGYEHEDEVEAVLLKAKKYLNNEEGK